MSGTAFLRSATTTQFSQPILDDAGNEPSGEVFSTTLQEELWK